MLTDEPAGDNEERRTRRVVVPLWLHMVLYIATALSSNAFASSCPGHAVSVRSSSPICPILQQHVGFKEMTS